MSSDTKTTTFGLRASGAAAAPDAEVAAIPIAASITTNNSRRTARSSSEVFEIPRSIFRTIVAVAADGGKTLGPVRSTRATAPRIA
jgi:hypothetical protein